MARLRVAVIAVSATLALTACGLGVPERATFSTSAATVEARYHSHCDDEGCGDGEPSGAPTIARGPAEDLIVTTGRDAEDVSATLSTSPTQIRDLDVESTGDERRWRIRLPRGTPPGALVSAFVEYGGGDQASYAVRVAPRR